MTAQKQEDKKMPRGFRFLLVLVMLTWLILGIQVMINSIGSQNNAVLSRQNDSNSIGINALKARVDLLVKRVEELDRKTEQLSRELDIAIQNYLMDQGPDGGKRSRGNISSNEEAYEDHKTSNNIPSVNEEVKSEFENAAFDNSTLTDNINDIGDRTAELEEKIYKVTEELAQSKENHKDNSLVIAAVKLRDAVKNENKFSEELDTINSIAESDSELIELVAKIEPHAEYGVDSIESLKEKFDQAAEEITKLELRSKTDPNIMDKALMRISSLVKVKKIEADSKSGSTEDILARIYQKLLDDNLSAAIDETAKLEGQASVIIQDWVAKAKATRNSMQTAENIFRHITKPAIKKAESESK